MKAAPNMDGTELLRDFEDKNIKITKCVTLKGKYDHSYSYLLSLPYDTQVNEIKKVAI